MKVQDLGNSRPREDVVTPLYPLSETEGLEKGSQIAETGIGVCCALDNPPINRFAHPPIVREAVRLCLLLCSADLVRRTAIAI